MRRLINRIKLFFAPPPDDIKDDYLIHCAKKNIDRIIILAIACMATIPLSYVLYRDALLQVHDARISLSPALYIAIAAVYFVVTAAFLCAFIGQRKKPLDQRAARKVEYMMLGYFLAFILFESISGTVETLGYGTTNRFIIAFMVVAFVPLSSKRRKLGLAVAFLALILASSFLIIGNSMSVNQSLGDFALLFFIGCCIMSIITQNNDMRTFSLQHNLIAINAELTQANVQLEQMTITDALTHISNRRAFNASLPRTWSSCCRDGARLLVLMMDIDHFKEYNDHYGHQMGDECLYLIAQSIASHFNRETDMVARFGGEEFVSLTIKNSPEDAYALAEKVRQGVEALQIPHESSKVSPYVTISVGMACIPGDKRYTCDQALRMADMALYRAKREGRNRTVAVYSIDEAPLADA